MVLHFRVQQNHYHLEVIPVERQVLEVEFLARVRDAHLKQEVKRGEVANLEQ